MHMVFPCMSFHSHATFPLGEAVKLLTLHVPFVPFLLTKQLPTAKSLRATLPAVPATSEMELSHSHWKTLQYRTL